jgi:hypothetical protein
VSATRDDVTAVESAVVSSAVTLPLPVSETQVNRCALRTALQPDQQIMVQ